MGEGVIGMVQNSPPSSKTNSPKSTAAKAVGLLIGPILFVVVLGGYYAYGRWQEQQAADRRERLNTAVVTRDSAKVKELLDKGIDAKSPEVAQLLQRACSLHNPELVRQLLDHGVDPNGSSQRGYPLEEACAAGDMETARLLLDKGADVHAGREAALISAAGGGDTALIALLLDRGARVNEFSQRSALMQAAWGGHSEAVDLLIARGANVNERVDDHMDFAGGTPLMFALRSPSTVKSLLRGGADPFIRDKKGETALTKAQHYLKPTRLRPGGGNGFIMGRGPTNVAKQKPGEAEEVTKLLERAMAKSKPQK